MRLRRTTSHENGVQSSVEERSQPVNLCYKQPRLAIAWRSAHGGTPIPRYRLTRAGIGTTFGRTWKREGRMTAFVTDLRRSNRLAVEALCKLWLSGDVD